MSIDTYDELAEALVTGKIEGYVNAGDELMVNQIKNSIYYVEQRKFVF